MDLRRTILELLLQHLNRIPAVTDLHYLFDETDIEADPVIEVSTEREIHRLIIKFGKNGQPRYARNAVAQLLLKLGQSQGNVYPVFAAPFVSESASEICFESGVGHIDLAGNYLLVFNGIYMERRGQPNRYVSRRSLRSLYQARSTRVLRALLFDPKLKWKLKDLSTAAGVSIGQVFNVKKTLLDREWALFDKDGLLLTQPEKLIRDWGTHYGYGKNTFYDFNTTGSPRDMESGLARYFKENGMRYALTSFSAFARMESATVHPHLFAYVDTEENTDFEEAANALNLTSGGSGAKVTLMKPYDDGVFFGVKEVRGIQLVSPIQIYLDLCGIGPEGREAAEIVLRNVVQSEWQAESSSD